LPVKWRLNSWRAIQACSATVQSIIFAENQVKKGQQGLAVALLRRRMLQENHQSTNSMLVISRVGHKMSPSSEKRNPSSLARIAIEWTLRKDAAWR
jgi:hypothetical protein